MNLDKYDATINYYALAKAHCDLIYQQWKEKHNMPQGTKVEKIYKAILRETGDKGKAARIAQAQTGKSLATGKTPKSKGKSK